MPMWRGLIISFTPRKNNFNPDEDCSEYKNRAGAYNFVMKRALITGIAGFAGSHLAMELLDQGWEVLGIERHGAVLGNLTDLIDRVKVMECDILSSKDVGCVIRRHKPDTIFHLAGTSFVPDAQNAPQLAFEINVKGTLNMLEETRENAPEAGRTS